MTSSDIKDLSLDVDIGSAEGLSVDQMTRSRLQFLLGQSAYIVRQTHFADAKAGTLLAIVGALAIIVADRRAEIPPYFLLAYICVTLLVVAICLITLMPRVPRQAQSEEMQSSDLFSWPTLSSESFDAEQYATLMRTSNASLLVMSIASSNVAIARVLRVKYRLLRIALGLALIDLLALGLVLSPALF